VFVAEPVIYALAAEPVLDRPFELDEGPADDEGG
jgi:hypothetical protein